MENRRKELLMFELAILIGLPIFIALASAGVLVDSTSPDELRTMGVERKS
jgi:hypothetical protein